MSISKLDKKLWTIFSRYIRLRDRFEGDYVKCVTCSHIGHWKTFDAGHFMSRRFKSVKFNEKNVNAQCKGCNGPKHGMQYEHGKAIDRKYGEGTAEWLSSEARKVKRYTPFELEELIKYYTKEVKRMQE